jgi:hypothetical protein
MTDEDIVQRERDRSRIERESLHSKVRPLLSPAIADVVFGRGDRSVLTEVATNVLSDRDPAVVKEIVFHLTDWRADAGCLLALIAHPEQFDEAEVRRILQGFLVHAPNHIAAAAVLAGYPIQDTFELGTLVDDE